MDRLQFISTVIGSLAWPAVALFIFCVLWANFPRLAPFVRQFKYGDVELHFGQRLDSVAEAAVAVAEDAVTAPSIQSPGHTAIQPPVAFSPPEAVDPESGIHEAPPGFDTPEELRPALNLRPFETDVDAYKSLAHLAPRGAVRRAWADVEVAAEQLLHHLGDKNPRLRTGRGLYNFLATNDTLNATELLLFRNLLELRDESMASESRLTTDEALRFCRAAVHLRYIIYSRLAQLTQGREKVHPDGTAFEASS